MKIRCTLPIELGHDIVTYCELPEGHGGRCKPQSPLCELCKALHQWWEKNFPEDAKLFYRPEAKNDNK